MKIFMQDGDWTEGRRTEVHFFDDIQTIRTEVYTDLGVMHSRNEKVADTKEYFRRKLKGE